MTDDIAAAAFARPEHRPWPLPRGPWILRQQWHDLLFLHWPVAADRLRSLVPMELAIQEFDGTSWIGVVPFRIAGLGWRGVPFSSAFPELNVRLYVEADGKPGVWFLSLDAASLFAVLGARAAFRLPYFHARMAMTRAGEAVHFESVRRIDRTVAFDATYRPAGPEHEPQQGTLEYFLTERYCLYTRWHTGRIKRLWIYHPPWRLQSAELTVRRNSMGQPFGIEFDPIQPPLVHFSREQNVVAWPLADRSFAGRG